MAQAKQQMGAGARYKANIANKKAPALVDVTVPSGEVFQFVKPSKFAMLFSATQLPLAATNQAVAAWKADGLVEEDATEQVASQAQLIKMAVSTADKVLQLSHTPKLVVGEAKTDNELSIDDVDPEDLEYLFKWVSAGGEMSAMLGTFPGGSQPDALASASRKNKRYPVQHIGGDQG